MSRTGIIRRTAFILIAGGSLPLFAQPVVHCPDPALPLAARWTWALSEAKSGSADRCWIGYKIVKLMGEHSFTGSFSSDERQNRPTLCEVIGLGPCAHEETMGKSFYDMNCSGTATESDGDRHPGRIVPKEVGFLFEVSHASSGEPGVRRLKVSNLSLHVDLSAEPLIWLGGASDNESVMLLEQRFKDGGEVELQKSVLSAVGMHSPSDEVVRFLGEKLQGEDEPSLRETAAFWLGQTDSDEALRLLMKTAGSDRSEAVREHAVFAISQMDSSRSLDALVRLARGQGDRDVRRKAMFWLGQKASQKSISTLGEIAASSDDVDIQKQALFALTQIPDHGGIDQLISIAKTHPLPRVRKEAIFWLGESGDERALSALIDILKK